jgi:hypothetical protein
MSDNENEFEFEGKAYIREEIDGISCDGCAFHIPSNNGCLNVGPACMDLEKHKNYIFKEKQ